MSHYDPEVLALRALGEATEPAEQDAHLAQCAHCAAELRQLAAVVGIARRTEAGDALESPPPDVWAQIAAATGVDAVLAAPEPGYQPASSGRQRRGRRRPLAVVVGVLAGLIIGAGVVAAIGQLRSHPAPAVVATIALRPLPQFPEWKGASGTAVMESGSSGRLLTVTLRAPQRPGFYEVWLLARNGVSMISLGDLGSGHAGAFTMPPGVNLRNYSRIDVSLQAFNGSTLHSRTSVVRGSLPG